MQYLEGEIHRECVFGASVRWHKLDMVLLSRLNQKARYLSLDDILRHQSSQQVPVETKHGPVGMKTQNKSEHIKPACSGGT